MARPGFRRSPGRLSERFSAGIAGLPRVALAGLARHVHGRNPAGRACVLCPPQVPESPAWQSFSDDERKEGIWAVLRRSAGLAGFAVVLMMALNFFAHGSQDLYPSEFLGAIQAQAFDRHDSSIMIVANIGGLIGGIAFGIMGDGAGCPACIAGSSLLGDCVDAAHAGLDRIPHIGVRAGSVGHRACLSQRTLASVGSRHLSPALSIRLATSWRRRMPTSRSGSPATSATISG